MKGEESILQGIRSRQYMLIKFIDNVGILRTDLIEGYTISFTRAEGKVLKGFHWASEPGTAYSNGHRIYPLERITDVYLTGHKFDRPQDEIGAKDSCEFTHIICDCHFTA